MAGLIWSYYVEYFKEKWDEHLKITRYEKSQVPKIPNDKIKAQSHQTNNFDLVQAFLFIHTWEIHSKKTTNRRISNLTNLSIVWISHKISLYFQQCVKKRQTYYVQMSNILELYSSQHSLIVAITIYKKNPTPQKNYAFLTSTKLLAKNKVIL